MVPMAPDSVGSMALPKMLLLHVKQPYNSTASMADPVTCGVEVWKGPSVFSISSETWLYCCYGILCSELQCP